MNKDGRQPGMRSREAGFTLVELSLTIVLAMLLGSLLVSVYLFSMRGFATWRRAVALETEGHVLLYRLTTDLGHAERIEAGRAEDGKRFWAIVHAGKPFVQYRHQDGVLVRNGHRMHGVAFQAAAVDLTLHAAGVRRQVYVRVMLVHEGDTLAVATAVTLRRPPPWPPLPANDPVLEPL